jgi:xanthine dehydrogenase small subunit
VDIFREAESMSLFALNNMIVKAVEPPGLPVLDYLRDTAGLKGVKHACREGDCGSCVVLLGDRRDGHLQYRVVTSCLLHLGAVAGCHVVTIEGLNRRSLGPIQRAFADEGASQCGFCTPGLVVALTGYLLSADNWDRERVVEAVAGNICRCTGYVSILRVAETMLAQAREIIDPADDRIAALVRGRFLPDYFLGVEGLFEQLVPATVARQPYQGQPVVSGGTDTYVQKPDELAAADVFTIQPPVGPNIWNDGGHVYLSGSATAQDIKESNLLKARVGDVDRAMTLMGSLPIRLRATVAGNIVNASPIGDMTIVLLALDAEIALKKNTESLRVLPLRDFFLGYKNLDLHTGELVEWVRFPDSVSEASFNFEKVSKRTYLDIATVNTAISVRLEHDRILEAFVSAGGVAPIPKQLENTGSYLVGREPTAETARGAAACARDEISPISDVRGSAAYKRLLLGQLVLAHFHVLFGLEKGIDVGATV